MENDKEKGPEQNRMKQDVDNTSRTMKPGTDKEGSTNTQNSANTSAGKGGGLHGDAEGHADTGSQSHKNSGDKKD